MNTEQLLTQIRSNRELLEAGNIHAVEHFQMLSSNYTHLFNEEVILNIELSKSYVAFNVNSDYRQAIDVSLAVLDTYRQTEYTNLLSRHMRVIGNSYAYLGEYDLAERFFIEAMDSLAPRDELYRVTKSHLLFSLAKLYEYNNKGHEKAVDYLNQAMALLTHDNDSPRRAMCYMGLGNIYNSLNNLPEALDKYNHACQIFEARYDLSNMANVYCNIGNCYLKQDNFDLAVEFQTKALQLRIKSGSPHELALSYYNFGVLYTATRELAQAEDALAKAFHIVAELGDKPFLAQINEQMDHMYAIKRRQKEKP
ncbi:MAG TPA: tetratricopeptide repeat protein [Chitinophagales bacterium]|nr:tetratricopeptide repeat protein [Chitinophagales bacterium]